MHTAPSNKQDTVFIVSHTHWDREWYFSQTTFQMMLTQMMDILFEALDEGACSPFFLDGQLVAIEDYLEVCPQVRQKLRDHIEAGRLQIGPWYVLPDEYLASGEAHIRNFMLGMQVAKDLGGGSRIGYLPDSFGHPSQIPQIIRGLGMEEMIFWRGPGPEVKNAEFIWRGKDGSCILALNMPYGYSNAACLPENPDARETRLAHEIDKLMSLSALRIALLMNGSDHIAPDKRVDGWIGEYAEKRPDLAIKRGSLVDYVAMAKHRANEAHLQTVDGELRSGYRAYLLGDTLSTRMPVKQRQRYLEALLERHLEPAFTLLAMAGKTPYPANILRYLWKSVLKNLPHDSICGCSVDKVYEEMDVRFVQQQDIAKHLTGILQKSFPVMGETQNDGTVVIFNGHLGARKTLVTVMLEQIMHPLRYVDYQQDQKLLEFTGEIAPEPTGIDFYDAQGNVYPGEVLSSAIVDTVESDPYTQPTMNRCREMQVSFCPDVPSLGYAHYAYRLRYAQDAQRNGDAKCLENQHFLIRAAQDGSLSVTDKRSGSVYPCLNRFVDRADTGDEYTYDPLPGDDGISMLQNIQISCEGNRMTISGSLRLPECAAPDRKSRSDRFIDCPVRTVITLPPDAERIDIRTQFDNNAMDHRLSVQFPLGAIAERCLSDSTFALENHEIITGADASQYDGWMEPPNNSFFMKNLVALRSGVRNLAVFVKGLPQAEIAHDDNQDIIELTLLRCVGWLSRPDLRSRDGNGGWTIATPGAQEIGIHSFEYSIYPFADAEDSQLLGSALDFAEGLLALQTSRTPAVIPEVPVSMLSADSTQIFCSALKRAECAEGWILRLANLSAEAANVSLTLNIQGITSAQWVSLDERPLDERPLGEIPIESSCIHANFTPWQIKTIWLR